MKKNFNFFAIRFSTHDESTSSSLENESYQHSFDGQSSKKFDESVKIYRECVKEAEQSLEREISSGFFPQMPNTLNLSQFSSKKFESAQSTLSSPKSSSKKLKEKSKLQSKIIISEHKYFLRSRKILNESLITAKKSNVD